MYSRLNSASRSRSICSACAAIRSPRANWSLSKNRAAPKPAPLADGSITSGVWECAPILVTIDAYSVNELMTVLSGSLNLTDASGKKDTFAVGDTFIIPKGTKVTLEITETLRKFYMIVK